MCRIVQLGRRESVQTEDVELPFLCGFRRAVIEIRDRLRHCRDAVISAMQLFLAHLNLISYSSDLVRQHLRLILSLGETLGAIRLRVIVVNLLRLQQVAL